MFHLPEWVPILGGEPITSFGVFMFLAFLSGGMLLRAEMERVDLPAEKAWDMLFMAVLGGVLGARIYYILLNYPQLAVDPKGLILSRGGMVWYGGFIGGVVLCLWSPPSDQSQSGPGGPLPVQRGLEFVARPQIAVHMQRFEAPRKRNLGRQLHVEQHPDAILHLHKPRSDRAAEC